MAEKRSADDSGAENRRNAGCSFKMLFVGDGVNRRDMEKMVRDIGLSDRVIFAGRVYDRQMLKNIYHRSSALLFPSYYDTSGIVTKEAAACYCPSVVAKGSCVSSGVSAENGYLVDDEPQSMAGAIIDICRDPARACTVGENAYRTLYRSWEDSVSMAAERYMYLINKKRGIHRSTSVI